jgi:hypothetical protein
LEASCTQNSAVDINEMMTPEFDSPDDLWDAILSREPERIMETWNRLNREEQTSVLEHLERMTSEDGWHPEQVISARVALEVVRKTRQ